MSDPAVTESWTRIVGWLGRNAPVTAQLVDPPSGALALRRAEAVFPAPWPADLREWYGLHDGEPSEQMWHGVLPTFQVPSLARMAELRDFMFETNPDDPDDPDDPDGFDDTDGPGASSSANDNAFAFLPHYVPIGEDGCGGVLYVDLRPGEHHGCVGEYDSAGGDTDTADPSWPSVAAMLADVADCLDSGQPILGWLVPTVEDGELSWVDVEETA